MKAEELVQKCEEKLKVGWNPIKYLKLAWYSFRGDFEGIKENISFSELEKNEIRRFIEACDNRIERAGILLNEIAMVLGFNVTAIAIVVSVPISTKVFEKNETIDPIISMFTGNYSIPFKIFVAFLFIIPIFLFVLLGHYRTHVHAWIAFKEGAILNK